MEPNKDKSVIPPAVQLFEIAIGFMKSQSIYVAAKLGIADLLKDGPKATKELAGLTGVHTQSLYRLLRSLASIGIFIEVDDHIFDLTPMAATLLDDDPLSLRPMVMSLGDKSWWHSWSRLDYSVKTGKSAFDHLFQKFHF